MILARLSEFADRLPEMPPPGYQPGFATKAIRIESDGTLRDVISLSGTKHGAREGRVMFLPREQPQRTVKIAARLIADNANYVLGKLREKDKPKQVEERHRAYCDLVRDCARATNEPAVLAVQTWIESGGPNRLRTDPDISDDDEFIFEVDGKNPTELHSVRDFWANREQSKHKATCLVTGEHGPVVDRMPSPIKGLRRIGGQMSGTALISVNNPSGESYGLSAALNSPIGKATAEKIGNALNYLLDAERHTLWVGKAVYVSWTREPEAEFSFFDFLKEPKPEDVRQLIQSVHSGRHGAPIESKDFFVLSLSANVSRIVVRDYHETTLETVKANLVTWFGRLEIVGPDGGPAPPLGVFRLAASLFRDAKDMPAHVPTALVASAMTGAPLPDYLLGLAVKRNLAMQGPFTEFKGSRRLSVERLALIKSILEQKEGLSLSALNTNHPDAAYHCGRLLALLEGIQRKALGDINATVVDRYYGAACASPGSILGNLVNDAQSHLAKMRKASGDGWAQNRLGEILSAIGDRFPRTLSLQRQGLFALGFYHQKAHDRAAAAEAKAKKQEPQGAEE